MSDNLRRIYEQENLLPHYFDKTVPLDLFRGQSHAESKKDLPIMYPNPGFTRPNGMVRIADVLIETIDGKEIVRGCRTTHGMYRGISTFDRKGDFPGFKWYKLPAGTKIPEGLAITQDSAKPNAANHYTIAPKDDMPLALFQAWLNVLNLALVAAA